MGQSQQFKASGISIKSTTDYQTDLRIFDIKQDPSSTSFSQKSVSQVIQITNSITEHPFEKYIISRIEQRFRLNSTFQNNIGISQKKPSSSNNFQIKQPRQWFQLSTKEQFLKIFTNLKDHYVIEKQLQSLYQNALTYFNKGLSMSKSIQNASICRKISSRNDKFQILLDEDLLQRLFYTYYMKLLKGKGLKVTNFHNKIGYPLCLLISYKQIALQQLFELFYWMVYIDKHDRSLESRLNMIEQKYSSVCLTKHYSSNISKRRYQIVRTAARLYLDQLYMTSIKQAEDPDIVIENDCLLPTRTFPIQKVKTKNKNM